jgi:hypothetical protein
MESKEDQVPWIVGSSTFVAWGCGSFLQVAMVGSCKLLLQIDEARVAPPARV